MNSVNLFIKGGGCSMTDDNSVVVVETDVLVKLFLKLLNDKELINNATYLATVKKLEKGDESYVDT